MGPWQYKEKLIPVVINSILKKNNIPVYGNGKKHKRLDIH